MVVVGCEPSSAPKPLQSPPVWTASAQTASSAVPVSSAAPDAAPGHKTLFVREVLADCEGEGPMKCMQVRESDNGEWNLHYGAIKGFKFEEGYRYELRVSPESVGNPPADTSSKRLRLVEIVSKQKVDK